MSEKFNISSLFDQSGNLTLHAMERFLRDELSRAERALVEKHLSESDFEREALEGLKKHSSTNFSQEVGNLQKEIQFAARKRAETGNFRISRISYWYAAAGLAGMICLSVLVFFMFREPVATPQLAVIQADTIIHKTVPDTEQAVNRQIQKSEDIRKNTPQSKINSRIKPVREQTSSSIEVTAEPLPSVINQEVVEFNQPVIEAEEIVEVVNDDIMIEDQIVGGVAIAEDNKNAEKRAGREEKRMSTNYATASSRADYEGDNFVPGRDADTNIFIVVEIMPEFPGGDDALIRFLCDSIQYPKLAIENKIQGRVFVSFIVNQDGSISDINVLRGIGGGCDEEAVRVIKSMPKWLPGKQRGIPVRVQYNLPVKFNLQ